jgi:anti-sigma factor RsiW
MTDRGSRYDAELDPRGRRDIDPYEPGDVDLRGVDPREGGRGRSMPSPGLIFLAIAIIGSILYMVFVISVRDSSQIPLMASGAVVLALVFGALAVYSLRAVLRAGLEIGQGGRAVLIAFVGGIAAIAAAGFAAGAIILFQIGSWSPS